MPTLCRWECTSFSLQALSTLCVANLSGRCSDAVDPLFQRTRGYFSQGEDSSDYAVHTLKARKIPHLSNKVSLCLLRSIFLLTAYYLIDRRNNSTCVLLRL